VVLESVLRAEKLSAEENEQQRLELQLCRSDCFRDQNRFDEAETIIHKALRWREKHLGSNDAETHAAVYDLTKCLRARHLHADSATANGHASGRGNGHAGEQARVAYTEKLDTQGEAAASSDKVWQDGLAALCALESRSTAKVSRWAEQIVMLASVAQLHRSHAEAVFLFRIAQPEYKVRSESSDQKRAEWEQEGVTAEDVLLEHAELLNSLGESLLELRHYEGARTVFAAAHAHVVRAQGDGDASAASVEANQAKLYAETGEVEQGRSLFERAHSASQAARDESLAASDDVSKLVMNQALHARVLKLYAEFLQNQGSPAEAEAMRTEMKLLETTYGFVTQ